MKTTYESILIEKLDRFIRKYYANQLIKGTLYTLAILLSALILLSFLEYFGHFSSLIRALLFYSFLTLLACTFGKWIVLPFVRWRKLGKLISYDEAAKIIGSHFNNVQDKLLNLLQLKQAEGVSHASNELLIASIDQKIEELRPVPFEVAIDFKLNLKYLKIAAIPALVLFLMSLIVPDVISEPSKRIYNYNREFVPQAPFEFLLTNEELSAVKGDDIGLQLKLKGSLLPNEVYLLKGSSKIKTIKRNNTEFEYTLVNLQEDVTFSFSAEGYLSKSYTIKVLPKPLILGFDVDLEYPNYLGKSNESLKNVGDITVPEGTRLNWLFQTESSNQMVWLEGQDSILLVKSGQNGFSRNLVASQSLNYAVAAVNDYVNNQEPINYSLTVIKDAFPEISLRTVQDSTIKGRLYCSGEIRDDYGLNKLKLYYRLGNKEGKGEFEGQDIPFNRGANEAVYFHVLDVSNFAMVPGDELEYYFEVADNDGVNGSKKSRTAVNWFKLQNLEEIKEDASKSLQAIKKELVKAGEDARKLNQELEKLGRKLTDKKEKTWEDEEHLNQLLEKQKELSERVEELKEKYQNNSELANKFDAYSEEIVEKQLQLNQLMEDLMSEEMKETMEKLKELMNELDKEKLNEEIDQLALTSEELSKELDRSLELMKQLEIEQLLEDNLNKLKSLQAEQENLKEKTEKASKQEVEEAANEQNSLNDKFEQLKEDMEELRSKNAELEFPNEMAPTEEVEKSISEDMEGAKNELEKGDKKEGAEKQQEAADGMEQMAQGLMQTKQNMLQKQAEDLDALRQLLDNIITASFDQEELMDKLRELEDDDPKYVEAMVRQSEIRDNVKHIEDSLFALSKRVVQIESMVNKEVSGINNSITRALKDLQERRTNEARGMQQFAMMGLNNLGLLLDEVIKQMQMQMASKMPGSGSCSKPGEGQPQKMSMSEMQKKLNERLKSMKEGKKNDGGKGEGGKEGGMGNMSKELAKMAARQAAIREELKKMDGRGENDDLSKEIEKIKDLMEQTESDIVNNRITVETLRRQEEITTRLLESEKAERERETDKERKSEEYLGDLRIEDSELNKYYKKSQNEVELLRTMIPSYSNFYKKKISDYFKSLSE